MKRIILISTILILLAVPAYADLNLLGQGISANGTYNLIYDTDLDITWYDYTSSSDTWDNQMNWADVLSVDFGDSSYDDWRLPMAVDGPYVFAYDGTTSHGYNITSSEMGHLYYTELENLGHYDTAGNGAQPGWGLTNTGYFQNLSSGNFYWSGTEYTAKPSDAYYFDFYFGGQTKYPKGDNFFAIAVMSGKAIVPEPLSSALFIVGGATLGFRRFWGKRRTI